MADITLNPTTSTTDPAVMLPHEERIFELPEELQVRDPLARRGDQESLEVQDLRQAVDELNTAMEALNQRYRFGIYEDTDQFYVQVQDAASGRVLRTRPIEDLLELRRRLQDMVGLVVDEEL